MSTKHTGAPVTLALLSNPRYLTLARALVTSFSRQIGFDERCSGHIALALDEALCNVIRHGYGEREDGPILVHVTPVEENGQEIGMRIVIEDEAPQVDPDKIRSRDLDEIRPGGLGVHIIREIMDDVRYERRDGGSGMRLILTRRLPSAGGRVLEPAHESEGDENT